MSIKPPMETRINNSNIDLSFQDYNDRVLHEITPERNIERATTAKPAGNFIYSANGWQPQEYEGFAVVAMVGQNPSNDSLLNCLNATQAQLKLNLAPVNAFYHLPPESFHQTVANTLSADRFKQNVLNPGLEDSYPAMVAAAFDRIAPANAVSPIPMKMAGLSIFGTAIGMLGWFENQADYLRILNFRAGFYDDQQLAELDVKMTRPFIGHITLAYIEHNLNKNQKSYLAEVVNDINKTLFTQQNYFFISQASLRRYHHLAEFISKDNYPVYQL